MKKNKVLTEQQRTLAIAAGMIGGRFEISSNVIVVDGQAFPMHYSAEGALVVDLSGIKQNHNWKSYYEYKIRSSYETKTALVNRIIASKGKSL